MHDGENFHVGFANKQLQQFPTECQCPYLDFLATIHCEPDVAYARRGYDVDWVMKQMTCVLDWQRAPSVRYRPMDWSQEKGLIGGKRTVPRRKRKLRSGMFSSRPHIAVQCTLELVVHNLCIDT